MESFDVCVRGAGIVGKSLALTLARQGLQVALLPEGAAAAQHAGEDIRAYALNAVSIELLQRLKVWDALPAQAKTAVHDMRVQGHLDDAEIGVAAGDAARVATTPYRSPKAVRRPIVAA